MTGLLDPGQVPDRLTVDILRGLACGRSNSEVATDCHISVRTLCRKLARIRELWQVETTIEAIVIAARFGLLPPVRPARTVTVECQLSGDS